MTLVEFFRDSFRSMHSQLDSALSEITNEQCHYRPEGCGNHIAFAVWHYARTEDNVIQGALQGKPSIWVAGGYDQKFGLGANAQGTGMSLEEAGNIRLLSPSEFLTYQKQVWEATDAYLASIDDSKLDEKRTLGRMGEMPVSRLIGNILLTHGFTHIGEVQYVRGLQGLQGAAR